MIDVNPSMLACDFNNLGKQISEINESIAKCLHLDVMDGVFVNNISYGMPIIASIRKVTNLSLDAHLMIIDPIRYIKQFTEVGCDKITFHYEATSNVDDVIAEIKKYGLKVGMSVKPDTSIDVLRKYLKDLDSILIMTVNPGFGGQKFITEQLEKISKCYNIIKEYNKDIDIQVDGGINEETIPLCAKSGANVFIAGSSIFKSDDLKSRIQYFYELGKNNYRG